jgi:uncharacterized coiled-coil protein SlyX
MNALFKGYDPLAERTQQERKPITAEEALFQEANKIVFASFDSLDPKPFIYKGTQNYFFKEFLSYLESNDIKSATSFIEEYLKVIFLFRALEEQNTTYDGRNTDHAGHQYASESVLVNSVNYKLVAIEQTIDRIADNNLDFGEEELSMEKVKEKLKELIKKMEDYENASRASIC